MVKRLEMEGKIEKIPIDPESVRQAVEIAQRDLEVARKNLEINNEWTYNISYNAVLAAGRALMFARGYRPKTAEGHVATKEFLGYFLKQEDVAIFDRMRRKRHIATYDISSTVSRTDAESAIRTAGELVARITAIIERDGFAL